MYNWFECKVKFEKTVEESKVMSVNEAYLIDALSFTEAEARIVEEMQPYISGDFTVANIRRVRFADVFFHETGDKWYRCRIHLVSLDEEKGIEKRSAIAALVQASEIGEALNRLHEGMKGTMSDYEVIGIQETPLMDVYKYKHPHPENTTQIVN